MNEEGDDKKVKGLFNLLTSMYNHYVIGMRTPLQDEKARFEMSHYLEADFLTIRGAIGKMRTIAKKRGYKEISKVIEEEMYKEGFKKNRL